MALKFNERFDLNISLFAASSRSKYSNDSLNKAVIFYKYVYVYYIYNRCYNKL